MRLIDADALIKDIAGSIRLADEWEKESHEKKDKIGLKYAIDTRRSLLSMISRVKEAKTIEAEPVRHGRWIELPKALNPDEKPCKCSACGHCLSFYNHYPKSKFCPNCGAQMGGEP